MLEAFVDAPLRHEKLTVFPIIAPHGPVLPYLLSTELQESGVLTIRVKGDNPVPVLLVRNNSLHPLLILAGEPLPGEDPGRLVERSILLGGKSVTQIPASPVEQGGWVTSDREWEITQWLDSFPASRKQVGFLAFLGNRMMGLEALGAPNLYGPLHRRLLIRSIKEAMSSPNQEAGDLSALKVEARRIVGAIGDADRIPNKRVGIGESFSLSGPVSGGDLTYQGHLVHLSIHSVAGSGLAPEAAKEGGGRCF